MGAGCQGSCVTFILGDNQNPAGHWPRQSGHLGPALSSFISCRSAPMLAKAAFPLEMESTGIVLACMERRWHCMHCTSPAEEQLVLVWPSTTLKVSHSLSQSLHMFLLLWRCQRFACSVQCGNQYIAFLAGVSQNTRWDFLSAFLIKPAKKVSEAIRSI